MKITDLRTVVVGNPWKNWLFVVLETDEGSRGLGEATLGLSTLLRGKYEIYMAQHIIGRGATPTGTLDGVLLMQLARRMLLRSSLLCAVLLVVTADLDIQAPQLQTVLQTYLPFVLSLPCVSVSTFLGEALRAASGARTSNAATANARTMVIFTAGLPSTMGERFGSGAGF